MDKYILQIRRSLLLILGFLLLNTTCTEPKDLKEFAERQRKKNNIPGMAVAVVKPDSILEMFTLGYRRHRHSDKIQLDDLFHIGSNTRAMTAFAAAHLVEEGLIDWSSRFIDLYPEWKNEIDSSHWEITLGDHIGKLAPS
ncbi:MAG: serine hydrolase [Bacteroidota bacterium]